MDNSIPENVILLKRYESYVVLGKYSFWFKYQFPPWPLYTIIQTRFRLSLTFYTVPAAESIYTMAGPGGLKKAAQWKGDPAESNAWWESKAIAWGS